MNAPLTRDGRSARRRIKVRPGRKTALTAATVITASPTPISVCTPSIAVIAVASGTVPESPSSKAAIRN